MAWLGAVLIVFACAAAAGGEFHGALLLLAVGVLLALRASDA